MMAPTEMSIPPEDITRVIPKATSITGNTWTSVFSSVPSEIRSWA